HPPISRQRSTKLTSFDRRPYNQALIAKRLTVAVSQLPMHFRRLIANLTAVVASVALLAATAVAQIAPPGTAPQPQPKIGLLQKLNPGLGGPTEGNHLTLAGSFTIDKASRRGTLTVTAQIEPTWHIYSLTQPAGGPQKSELKVADSP